VAMNKKMNDPGFVNSQYQDSGKLNARIRLHQECSTNPYGWHRWLFDMFSFPDKDRVLELGCGSGDVWLENSDRIKQGRDLILSDRSLNMVAQARINLEETHYTAQYAGIDAGSIPFISDSMDAVIANHMLYHVGNLPETLAEIVRILKPEGVLYASTIGLNHMKELGELMDRLDPLYSGYFDLVDISFSLENGEEVMKPFFSDIRMHRYTDSLDVKDPDLLADYILSSRGEQLLPEKQAVLDILRRIMDEHGGSITIHKDSGVFTARNPQGMAGVQDSSSTCCP